MERKAQIIRGIVVRIEQIDYGLALAIVEFGWLSTAGCLHAKGTLEISGKPVKQGEMFGIQWGDESQVWLVGSVVEIVL